MPRVVVWLGLNAVSLVPFIRPFSQTYATASAYQASESTSANSVLLPSSSGTSSSSMSSVVSSLLSSSSSSRSEEVSPASGWDAPPEVGRSNVTVISAVNPKGFSTSEVFCSVPTKTYVPSSSASYDAHCQVTGSFVTVPSLRVTSTVSGRFNSSCSVPVFAVIASCVATLVMLTDSDSPTCGTSMVN